MLILIILIVMYDEMKKEKTIKIFKAPFNQILLPRLRPQVS